MNIRSIKKDIDNQDWASFFADMASAIKNRKISRSQIKNIYSIVRNLESGKFFVDDETLNNINTKQYEWDFEYLEFLFSSMVNGCANEKMALHMWEVSNKIKWKDARYLAKVCIVSASVLAETLIVFKIIF